MPTVDAPLTTGSKPSGAARIPTELERLIEMCEAARLTCRGASPPDWAKHGNISTITFVNSDPVPQTLEEIRELMITLKDHIADAKGPYVRIYELWTCIFHTEWYCYARLGSCC